MNVEAYLTLCTTQPSIPTQNFLLSVFLLFAHWFMSSYDIMHINVLGLSCSQNTAIRLFTILQ